MRMTLIEVHLRNFRIHEDYVFRPARNGITSIIGGNGRGKSSIIDGIAWALYGTKPDGSIKTSDLRRIGADPKDECYVEVTMILDGSRTLKVRRSIKNHNSVQCDCWLDGVLESGGSVSNADRWIPATMGIDKDGFLSAVLVQQKQVGEIVSETAAVRQRNIEKLTGITAATNAVKLARDESNSLKKAMDIAAPDIEDAEATRKTLKQSQHELDQVQKDREKLKDEALKAKTSCDDTAAKLQEARQAAEQRASQEHAMDLSKQHLRDLEKNLNDTADRIAQMRAGLPKVKDASGLEKQYQQEYARLEQYNAAKAQYDAIIANDAPAKETKAAEARIKAITIPDEDRQALEENAEHAQSAAAASAKLIAQYRQSLEALKAGDRNVQCPTCLQPIHDVTHVRKEFETLIASAEDDATQAKQAAESARKRIAAYDAATADMNEAKGDLQTLNQRHDQAKDARKALAGMKPDMEASARSVRSLAGKISDVKAGRRIIDEFKSYSDAFKRQGDEYAQAEKESQEIAERLKSMEAPSKQEISRLEKRNDSLRQRFDDLRDKGIELKGRKTLLDERIGNAKDSLARAEKQEKERAMVRRQYQVAQDSLAVLTAFREHLASEAVPQITDYAGDLLTEITGGGFISVSMSEKYAISVKRGDGSVLDVHMLSGGERDIVAICLRLAISMMLSGGEPSMLILDEVLTAMDDTMSSAILKAIQSSGHGQVIIIAHNDIVSTIADKPVEL